MPYFSGPNGIREVADPGERVMQSYNTARRGKLLSDFFTNGQTDIGALARLDPEAAQQIQAQQKQQGLAKMFADLYSAPEDQRPQGIAALLGADPKMGMEAAKMFDPRFATGNESPADVRSFEYFANGLTPEQRKQAQLEKLGLGPQKQANAQFVDVPDGMGGMVKMVFDPQTRQFSKPQFPGSGQQAPQQDVQGNPIAINYDGPPEDRAAFEQLVAADSRQPFAPGQYSAKLPDRVLSPGAGRLGYAPPKAAGEKESYRTLAPQEVQQLGLPSGTVAQMSPSGQVQIVNKPNAIPGGQTQVIDNGDGTQTIIPAGKTTEDQNKSAGYALRMEKALQDIASSEKADPSANRPGIGVAMLDMLPTTVGNYGKSAERQNVEAAQLDALDAALTLNTGAAYTKEQLYGLRKSYFPQPGDEPSTIKAKKSRLEGLIQTARLRARGAYPGKPAGQPPAKKASGPLRYNPATGDFD